MPTIGYGARGTSGAPLVGGWPDGPLFISANHAIYIWASGSSLGYLIPMGNRQLIRGVGASRRIAIGPHRNHLRSPPHRLGLRYGTYPPAEVAAAGDIAPCRSE